MILTGMENNSKSWGQKIDTIIENIKFCMNSIHSMEIEQKPLTFLHISNSNTIDGGG